MIDTIEVPDELMGSYKRIARRIPVELKKDEELLKTVVAYLQLGGERLARQAIDTAKQTHDLEVAQRKKKAREDALIRAAEARLAATDEENTSEDDDEYEDDDDDDGMKSY